MAAMLSSLDANQPSHKGAIRRGLFGRRTTQAAPKPKRVNGEDFFGIEGVATTREQTRVHTDRPGDVPPPIHRTPPTDPDPVLKNILAIASKALVERWSSTKSNDELAPHFDQLRLRAGRELEAAQTIGRRLERGIDETARMAAAIATADAIGALDAIDPVAAGAAMARRAVHASDPLAETGLIPVIRESGALAAPAPSPVHVGDGTAPPLPEAEASNDEPAPLPKRHPAPVRPVHWISVADHPDVHGKLVDPAKTEIAAGDWVMDEGSDCSGGPAWGLVAEVAVGGDSTLVEFASTLTVEFKAGRLAHVLTSAEADKLLAGRKSGGAA
jgi:hypothetical protein